MNVRARREFSIRSKDDPELLLLSYSPAQYKVHAEGNFKFMRLLFLFLVAVPLSLVNPTK